MTLTIPSPSDDQQTFVSKMRWAKKKKKHLRATFLDSFLRKVWQVAANKMCHFEASKVLWESFFFFSEISIFNSVPKKDVA